MALDAFGTEALGDKDSLQGIIYGIYGNHAAANGSFFDTDRWYEGDDLEDTVRSRFLAYLSNYKQSDAEEILKKLRVKDGLSGLDFSESKVEGSDLKLVVTYELKYEYQLFGFTTIKLQQKCCSRLWK